MMAFYPVPQLMQVGPSTPVVLLGTERLNRGYKGPILRVRRSSDNTTKDCYSTADIVSHCTGTNGFVNVAYDQSGNGKDYSQGTNSFQPKIYDSSTGLVKTGPLVGLSTVTASQQNLGRGDNGGLPNTGNPAITSLIVLGVWSDTSPPNPVAFAVGHDASSGANAEKWYLGRTSPILFLSTAGGGGMNWTPNPAFASNRTYSVIEKASGANANTTTCRENKNALSPTAATSGTLNFSGSGVCRWGCSTNGGSNTESQWATMQSSLLAHYNAILGTPERDALEQYMHRMITAG